MTHKSPFLLKPQSISLLKGKVQFTMNVYMHMGQGTNILDKTDFSN